MARAAVLQIPGVNCEYETVRALESVGIEARIVRFNESAATLSEFDAYALPGGFAFQDRIRAGAVAAKLPAVERIAAESERGKPVLGICNGAQILVESGLVPGIRKGSVEFALAPNRAPRRQGYLCRWIHVQAGEGPGRTLWASTLPPMEGRTAGGTRTTHAVPLPMAHGEGRFETADPAVAARIQKNGLALFRYVDHRGDPATGYPDDPNGSFYQTAGMTNLAGNVLALMPHPERASWLHQVPLGLNDSWGTRRRRAVGSFERLEGRGPGRFLFESLARHLGVPAMAELETGT